MSSDERPKCATLGDRIVIGIICAPVTWITGRAFLSLLGRSLDGGNDYFSVLVYVVLSEFTGAIWLLFLFATLWALTGAQRFDRLAWANLGGSSSFQWCSSPGSF